MTFVVVEIVDKVQWCCGVILWYGPCFFWVVNVAAEAVVEGGPPPGASFAEEPTAADIAGAGYLGVNRIDVEDKEFISDDFDITRGLADRRHAEWSWEKENGDA